MSHTREDDALRQLQQQQSKLLDTIDELRGIGVGGLIDFPQLIVCGNQSAGKSSVLEAISRVRFPTNHSICTRFATEFILRQSPSPKTKISIEPGPSRTDSSERQRLQSFSHEGFSSGNDLPALIEKAKEHMGITDSANSVPSDDVLKVELSGPGKPELTLVDLPGLDYSSQDQAFQAVNIVRGLAEKYMSDSRSIILAVISAKSDYHLQEVLKICQRFDQKRERTIGIITQPDVLEANSDAEDTYIRLIQKKCVHLELGWHCVRNRSFETRDISDEERDEREKEFFKQGRWTTLPRESVGIDSLRRRLSSILLGHIRRNLPGLIADIQEKVTHREKKLLKLGPSRSTIQQQRGYLLNVSSGFERIIAQALNGTYADDFFGGLYDATSVEDFRRLRAVIRQLNEFFAEAMAIRGCRREIIDSYLFVPEKQYDLANPYMEGWKPTPVLRDVLQGEISDQASRNRGIELPGNINQLVVGGLFRDQCTPWEGLGREHLLKAWESARYFVLLVLQHLTDDHTYALLFNSVFGPEFERLKEKLLDKLNELTAYTKRGRPLPVGKSFLTRVQKTRSDRQLKFLRKKLAGDQAVIGVGSGSFTMESIKKATAELESSRGEFAADDIIDQMQAYYDTAVVTFVDNIATLGIENCLLDPLQHMFTGQFVNSMDDDQIQELAAEPSFISDERSRLKKELERLQAALQTLSILHIKNPFPSRPTLFSSSASRQPTAKKGGPETPAAKEPATVPSNGTSLLNSQDNTKRSPFAFLFESANTSPFISPRRSADPTSAFLGPVSRSPDEKPSAGIFGTKSVAATVDTPPTSTSKPSNVSGPPLPPPSKNHTVPIFTSGASKSAFGSSKPPSTRGFSE
ncbi:dynamin family protein [Paecilomyces variotii No. 5]|uniref:Dynamin family protein n=1 Tax=Byssochlamys spectabilis (strain No. 5 / NBRC 109023) TaxID=1356009 RepID=V5FYY0_BYSSN|nr:dynamin family protein [Paecilomyces variotii No. 5]